MDDLPRVQFDDEKRKERTKEQVIDLEEITGPDISPMITEEGLPGLPL